MDALFNIFSAFGLSGAAGFNAYIPLLVVGLLTRYTELWHLQAPFDTLGSPVVLIVLAILGLVDFLADKIPIVDHAAHIFGMIANPVAGAILFASQAHILTDLHPAVALLAGVVVAGGLHASRAAIRPVATATTGGIGNPVLSLLEDGTALALSALAIFLPVLAFVLVLILALVVIFAMRRIARRVRPRL